MSDEADDTNEEENTVADVKKKRQTKDYGPLIAKESKLMARVNPKKPWPRQLTDVDFWFDDFEIYLRELERFVSKA